jgi:predicted ribosome quality control (RQC) complex YloA/Tae2 family protein
MQKELSDLIRDAELSENKAELLCSRLQQWNLLDDAVKVKAFCSYQKKILISSS